MCVCVACPHVPPERALAVVGGGVHLPVELSQQVGGARVDVEAHLHGAAESLAHLQLHRAAGLHRGKDKEEEKEEERKESLFSHGNLAFGLQACRQIRLHKHIYRSHKQRDKQRLHTVYCMYYTTILYWQTHDVGRVNKHTKNTLGAINR